MWLLFYLFRFQYVNFNVIFIEMTSVHDIQPKTKAVDGSIELHVGRIKGVFLYKFVNDVKVIYWVSSVFQMFYQALSIFIKKKSHRSLHCRHHIYPVHRFLSFIVTFAICRMQ